MDTFPSILEFTKHRKECLFCHKPLKAELIIFNDYSAFNKANLLREKQNATTRVPLINDKVKFHFSRTIPRYINSTVKLRFNLEVDIEIDIKEDILFFSNWENNIEDKTSIDMVTVQKTFENCQPYVEVFCDNVDCDTQYHFWSNSLRAFKMPQVPGWAIGPAQLVLEAFVLKHYLVHNFWNTNKSRIYTLKNDEAKPLETTLLDLSNMDKDRLLARIQLLVTFS